MSELKSKGYDKKVDNTQLRKKLAKLFENQTIMKTSLANGRKSENEKIEEKSGKIRKNSINMKTNENVTKVQKQDVASNGLPKTNKTNSFKTQRKPQENIKASKQATSKMKNKETLCNGMHKETKASSADNTIKQKKEQNGNAKATQNGHNQISSKAKTPNSNSSKTKNSPQPQQSNDKQKESNNKRTTNGAVKAAEPKKPKKKANKTQIDSDSIFSLKRPAPKEVDQPKQKKKKSITDMLEEPYNSYDDTDFEMSDSNTENSEDSKNSSYVDSEELYDDEDEESTDYSSDGEEEDDEIDYEMHSDDSSCAWGSVTEEDDDQDYRLPHTEVEDLIIHKGTAQMRPIKKQDNIHFDPETEQGQIVELNTGQSITPVEQPKAYLREALNELNEKHKKTSHSPLTSKEPVSDDNECPTLVPIVDEDGFELYYPDMDMVDEEEEDFSDISLGSYEEVSDDEFSEDINSKYMKDESSDYDTESELDMSADVIKPKKMVLNKDFNFLENQGNNELKEPPPDVLPSEIWLSSNMLNENKTLVVESSILDQEDVEEEETKENVSNEADEPSQSSVEFSNDEEISVTEATVQQPSQLIVNSFRTFFCNAADSNYVLALLKEPFCIYGTVRLEVLVGSVEVYGCMAGPGDELEVFSPRGCSYVQVASKPNPDTKKSELRSKLLQLETYFGRKELEHIADHFTVHTDALILLKRNEQCKHIVNTFKKHMNENVFPNMNAISMERPHYTSEYLLGCLVTEASGKQLVVPSEWNQLPLEASSKIILAGGKSVGKSTLVRYLINRHIKQLQQVLLVDLDIGQPEMFVPQTVSCSVVTHPLLGPGWFLNRQPRKAFLVGNINPVLAPHIYLKAIRQLIEYCLADDELKGMPWLVNTMGYNKGFGLELMALIRHLVQPTDIIQLVSNKEINNFDILLDETGLGEVPAAIYAKPMPTARQTYRLHVLASAVRQESRFQKEWNMSAKDMRYAMVLARLSDALQGNAEFLNDCKPLCASLDNLKLVTMSSCEISQLDLAHSMKTSLVYLCHGNKQNEVDNGHPLECLGLGVTRGFDSMHDNIYLHPAMPVHFLARVDCLAISEIPLPTTLFMRQSSKIDSTCPFLYNTVVGKSTKSVKQIYHRPDQFLKGHHKKLVDLD